MTTPVEGPATVTPRVCDASTCENFARSLCDPDTDNGCTLPRDWPAEWSPAEGPATVTLTETLTAERERLRQVLLRTPMTNERDTYEDGYGQGLASGIDALDRVAARVGALTADLAAARADLRSRLYVALVEQRVIDSQKYGEAPYAPITWEDVDRALLPAAPTGEES